MYKNQTWYKWVLAVFAQTRFAKPKLSSSKEKYAQKGKHLWFWDHLFDSFSGIKVMWILWDILGVPARSPCFHPLGGQDQVKTLDSWVFDIPSIGYLHHFTYIYWVSPWFPPWFPHGFPRFRIETWSYVTDIQINIQSKILRDRHGGLSTCRSRS